MPVTATCPECQATYKLAEAMFGKQVRCKKCQKTFLVGKPPRKVDPKKTMMAEEDAIQAESRAASGKKTDAKKTMMAEEDAVQAEAAEARPLSTGGKANKVSSAAAARRPSDDDDVVEAEIAPARESKAPARKPSADDDEIVEAEIAPPKGSKPRGANDEIVEVQAATPRPAMKAAPVGPPPRAQAKPAARADDDFDDPSRPREGRRQRDDYDDDPRGPRDDRGFDDDFGNAPPKKKRLGLIIGIVAGTLVVVGGVILLLFMMMKSDPTDHPEVARNLEKLKDDVDRDSAIFFFATFDDVEKQKRRKEVADRLELILENRLDVHRGGRHDDLITAYCRWSTAENIPGLAKALDRVIHNEGRQKIYDALAGFKDAQAAAALVARLRRHPHDARPPILALEKMGDVGEAELAKFVFDREHGIRFESMEALRRMGTKDEKFLDGALTTVTDRLHPNRQPAMDFLKNFRDPPAARSKEVCTKLFGVLAERTHNPDSGSTLKALETWVTKESASFVVDQALVIVLDKTQPPFGTRNQVMELFKNFRSPPAERSKEVCEKLGVLVKEGWFNDNAVQALATWLSKESAAAVAKALYDAPSHHNCERLLTPLAAYKDVPGVPEALAKRMEGNPGESALAGKLLTDMGPAISNKAMVSLFHTPNFGMREKVRLMLSKAGVSHETLVEQSIKDISSTNWQVRNSALEFMIKATVVPKLRDEAAKTLNPMLYTEDFGLRELVFQCSAVWWTTSTSEIWIKMAKDDVNQGVRHKAIWAMGKTGNPGFAPYVAPRLANPTDRGHVRDALINMGSKAEGDVAKLLFEKDGGTRHEAAQILGRIGTPASIMALQNAAIAYNSDGLFGVHVKNAIKAIASK